jgi:hypothetical protein
MGEDGGIVVGGNSWGLVGIGGMEDYRVLGAEIEALPVMEVWSRLWEEIRKSEYESMVSVWDRGASLRRCREIANI